MIVLRYLSISGTTRVNDLVQVNQEDNEPIALDSQNKSWLKVNSEKGSCFIRARSNYVIPLTKSEEANAVLVNKSVLPKQDDNGYYYDWENWDVWRVVPSQLNCRESASLDNQNISKTFVANELIYVDQATTTPITIGTDNKPWLKVGVENSSCFVKARSIYVVPSG